MVASRLNAARTAMLLALASGALRLPETGGLDEYKNAPVPNGAKQDLPETGGYRGYIDEGGYDDMGGVDDEDGGFEDDEDGGYDDEEGGLDGTEGVDGFIEYGGKRGKRQRLFKKRKNKKKKRRTPSPFNPAAMTPYTYNAAGQPVNQYGQVIQPIQTQQAMNCAQMGYGTLDLSASNVPIKSGLPYVSYTSGIRVIQSPIPEQQRIPAEYLKHGLINTALRTSLSPINATSSPAAGAFTLNVNVAAGQLMETIGLVLDLGPQPLNTQAGAVLTVAISGKYVDGQVASLGNFSFALPSTTNAMRIVFFFYVVQNGAARPKQMFCSNAYTTPYTATPDNVTQNIVVSGSVPAGIFLSATLLGPSQPTYENLMNALGASCSCKG